MRRVPFRNHGIAGSHGGREVPSRRTVKSEWEIVRPKNDDWSDRCQPAADIVLRVDRRQRPSAITSRRRRLPKLIRGPRQFGNFQSRLDRQPRLLVGSRDELARSGVDAFREAFQKTGKTLAGSILQFPRNLCGSEDRSLDLGPIADGILAATAHESPD